MTGTPSTSALALSKAANLADLPSAQAALRNVGGVSAVSRAVGFYEPLFQTAASMFSLSGAAFSIASGGGLVSSVNGTQASGIILLPKINDATKPWRMNVRMVYNGDASHNTLVCFQNPNDTSYGSFNVGFAGGQIYVGVGGGQQIGTIDGCVNGQTYDFFAASDGNQVSVGSIPLGHGGIENNANFSSHAAAETFNTYALSYTSGGHAPPYQNTGQIQILQSSSANVIKGILFNQGGLGGGADPRFQPPCICPVSVTRPDGAIDNTGQVFIPESYTGASQFDLALVGHPNASSENTGFRLLDPDSGTAFAYLRNSGVAMAFVRGDPASYSSNYASPWGAAIGVGVWKQFLDTFLTLLPGPATAPSSVKNLHLIGQSMGALTMLNFAMNHASLPVRSFSGISGVVNLLAAYTGANGGTNFASTVNGAFLTYYLSLSGSNSANAVTNTTFWQQITPPGGILPKPYATYTNRGTYSSGTAYNKNDVVSVAATSSGQVAIADPNLRPDALNNLAIALWHGASDTLIPTADTSAFVTTMTNEGNVPTLTSVTGGGHLNVAGLWNGAGLLANINAGNARAAPTPLAISIQGVSNSSTAPAGIVGEEIASTVASGAAVPLTSGAAANVTSISLTAGDWLVDGVVDYHPDTTTTTAYLDHGISTASATIGAQDTFASIPIAIGTTVDAAMPIPSRRLHLAVLTTVYLVAKAGFSVSTLSAYGSLHATRLR